MTDKDSGSLGANEPEGEDRRPPGQRVDPAEGLSPSSAEDSDVELEVPMLNVEEIDLEVEELRAHISARAELVDFLNIGVGVDVYLNNVKLQVKGVEARLQLKVKLERMLGTIDRALDVMANDPRRSRGRIPDSARSKNEPSDPGNGPDAPEKHGNDGDAVADEPDGMTREAVSGDLSGLKVEDEGKIVGLARDESGNLFERKPDDGGNLAGTGAGGEENTTATNAAREKAQALGVDLSAIEGSGRDGRILIKDVQRAAEAG